MEYRFLDVLIYNIHILRSDFVHLGAHGVVAHPGRGGHDIVCCWRDGKRGACASLIPNVPKLSSLIGLDLIVPPREYIHVCVCVCTHTHTHTHTHARMYIRI